MNKKLYDLMDWGDVEEVVYSESTNPERILGMHKIPEGLLIQAFFPGATNVELVEKSSSKMYKMEVADEAGFFAVLIPKKRIFKYTYNVYYENQTLRAVEDLYSFTNLIENDDLKRFEDGNLDDAYHILGAHVDKVNNISGVRFAVWAPNAMRVSVIGDFNNFDGTAYQMMKLGDSNVFELFIPNVKEGSSYRYEMKLRSGKVIIKNDPYAMDLNVTESERYSSVPTSKSYIWKDMHWYQKIQKKNYLTSALNIYEVHLGSFLGEVTTYEELAEKIIEKKDKLLFTHILLFPIAEYDDKASAGFMTSDYYSPCKSFGDNVDFKIFINKLHRADIGVILGWSATYFPKAENSLYKYDGNSCYENNDANKANHPFVDAARFDFEKNSVRCFLKSNALFWIEEYHIDGLSVNSLETAIFTDYGKIISSNYNDNPENLYTVNEYGCSFFRELNALIHNKHPEVITIAEEIPGYQGVTYSSEEDSSALGFDFKYNDYFRQSLIEYMCTDPSFKKNRHELITDNMVYAYSENFILPLSHNLFEKMFGARITMLPGNELQRNAELKLLYAYHMTHPGKKMFFMALENALNEAWSPDSYISYYESNNEEFSTFLRDLNKFYLEHPALFDSDYETEGFSWMSCLDSDHSIITFSRNSSTSDEVLFVIINFAPVLYENFIAGVPFFGTYKEIFSSDNVNYGGSGHLNQSAIISKDIPWDGREYSINAVVPPLSMIIFEAKKLE
ncbi:MAG: 1,4-alpha-glucan branching enzyme [Lachnospiraceae bacterium]|nr:1,4-alpha-glucan branching enzyme [Lachnospiraceae bacterium]